MSRSVTHGVRCARRLKLIEFARDLIAAMGKRGTLIQRRKDAHAHCSSSSRRTASAARRSASASPAAEGAKGGVVMGGTRPAAGPRKASKMRMKLKGKKVKLGLLEIKQNKAKRQAERKASKAKAPEAQRPPR